MQIKISWNLFCKSAFHLVLATLAGIICPCLTFGKTTRMKWSSKSAVSVKWHAAILNSILNVLLWLTRRAIFLR